MRDVQLSLSTGTRRKRFISFEFRIDVFHFLFGRKGVTSRELKRGYKSFNLEDFNPIFFTPGWDTVFDPSWGRLSHPFSSGNEKCNKMVQETFQ